MHYFLVKILDDSEIWIVLPFKEIEGDAVVRRLVSVGVVAKNRFVV